jgi:hypothetical protein|tara:strand:- start:146 stop:427 length:282 start_codon:yes stop_codon:yes gene_type:complete
MKYIEDSDLFYDKYKPVYNHLEHEQFTQGQTAGDDVGSVMYFETYGEDLKFVKEHDDKFIWTLIEEDDKQYISQGFSLVNALNYLIASVPFKK